MYTWKKSSAAKINALQNAKITALANSLSNHYSNRTKSAANSTTNLLQTSPKYLIFMQVHFSRTTVINSYIIFENMQVKIKILVNWTHIFCSHYIMDTIKAKWPQLMKNVFFILRRQGYTASFVLNIIPVLLYSTMKMSAKHATNSKQKLLEASLITLNKVVSIYYFYPLPKP